ncbi:hypothetical protein BH10PAT3_BH10PAT3_6710 [soil metagenome]
MSENYQISSFENLHRTRTLQNIYGWFALEATGCGIVSCSIAKITGSLPIGVAGLGAFSAALIAGCEWNDCVSFGDKTESMLADQAIEESKNFM